MAEHAQEAGHGIRRWRQFSLRALLLLMSAVAASLAAWQALGPGAALGVFVGAAMASPAGIRKGSWRRAYTVSFLAVYGPFFVMAVYSLLFVPCVHCKATACMLLPVGPALLPAELASRWLDLPRLADAFNFAVAFCLSAAILAGLGWFLRKTPWWWQTAAVTATLAFLSYTATATLALIHA